MKRIIIAILLICILITPMVACDPQTTTPDPKDPSTENTKLAKLDELAQKLENNFVIDVLVSSTYGLVASEQHTITTVDGHMRVFSKIERINSFVIEGDVITAPDSYSTIVEKELSEDEIANGNFNVPAFNFKTTSLSSIISMNGVTTAKLGSIKSFLGITITGKDAKIIVNHTDDAISSIEINYVTPQNNSVTIKYTFK